VHLRLGCKTCHGGDENGGSKAAAHKGLIVRPSDDLKACGNCHKAIADTYAKSLHYTSAGQRHGVKARFSPAELAMFDKKVFNQSCRSCHASCGDCHVKSPPVSGISLGLIAGHKFVKKDEGKTCAFCHGGRVYPEFTGEYGGSPDVHYQKGMMCMDCHKKSEIHGDGTMAMNKQSVKDRPRCVACHKLGDKQMAHNVHQNKVTCQGCHVAGEYRQCENCHVGPGSMSKPGFILGRNPRDSKTLTTLRLVPAVRDTFKPVGIAMSSFDALPNYWDSPVHSIKKRTARTRSCDSCHGEREGFLKEETLIKDGSKANRSLIYNLKPLGK
jgi:hypothetical protein